MNNTSELKHYVIKLLIAKKKKKKRATAKAII